MPLGIRRGRTAPCARNLNVSDGPPTCAADPQITPEVIKPEWYFFFIYYPLEMLPFWVVMLAQNVVLVALFAAPWLFRGASRKTLTIMAGAAAAYLVVMTLFGEQIYHLVKGV